jgi:hypothetical protein
MTAKKTTVRLDVDALGSETLLSPFDAARFLGLSVRSLERYRAERLGPKFIRLSPHAVRYRVRDLQEFCASREVKCA